MIDDVIGLTFDRIVFLEEHLALLETVRQLPVVGLRQGDGLEAHDEGDGAEDEDDLEEGEKTETPGSAGVKARQEAAKQDGKPFQKI